MSETIGPISFTRRDVRRGDYITIEPYAAPTFQCRVVSAFPPTLVVRRCVVDFPMIEKVCALFEDCILWPLGDLKARATAGRST